MSNLYKTERTAKKAMREIAAMWPAHRFAIVPCGFDGFGVFVVRDGKPAVICNKLEPLPFTVTASVSAVVFGVEGKSGNALFGGKVWPTHRRALNALRRFCPTGCISPAAYYGPFQPQVLRRMRFLSQL
ncbi:MAG: hypothetical protein WC806_03655 [Candidatus Gracilibacteria bacterium]|jgi:hypothetical protein